MARFLRCSLAAALVGDIGWWVRRAGHGPKHDTEAGGDRGIADGSVPETDDRRAELHRTDDDRGYATDVLEEHDAGTPEYRDFDAFGADVEHVPRDRPHDPPRCTERRTELAA